METLKERLLAFVDKNEKDCWIWRGSKNTKTGSEYGRINIDGICKYAHRISYEVFIGEIPEDCDIHHKCEEPSCINPEHLIAELPHLHRNRLRKEKTFCLHGHEYTEQNTRVYQGRRWCRACDNERSLKRYYHRKGEK